MLNLTAGDHKLGDTIDVEGQVPKLISVTAHLRSDQEIEALEIVQDGNVVASVDLRKRFNGSALDEKLNQEL